MWDWIDSFTSTMGDASTSIWAALVWIVGLIGAVASVLLQIDANAWSFQENILTKVKDWAHAIWDAVFKGIILAILKKIRDLHKWLEDHLGPIIQWLAKARAWLDRIWRMYFKPMLNMIQHVRQFLLILRLLGVKWAAALDAKLGKFEADIANLFLTVRGILTGFLGILNAVADPLNLLRRPTIVLSIRRIIPSLVKVSTGYPVGFFLPSPRKNAAVGVGQLPFNFDPGNSVMNPPASSYFTGDDGLGTFSGFTSTDVPPDNSVDDLTPLDYFDDSLYDPGPCDDVATCLEQMTNQALNTQLVTTQGT